MSKMFGICLIAWFALFLVAPAGCSQTVIYTNEADFVAATDVLPTFLNDFTNDWYNFGYWMSPLRAGNDCAAYWMSTVPPLDLFTFDGVISTVNTTDEILLRSASGNIAAVGGLFYAADANGLPTNGALTLLLSDGASTNVTSEVGGQPQFIGFFCPGRLITSLTVSNAAGNACPAFSHLYAAGYPVLATSPVTAGSAVFTWAAPPAPVSYVLQTCATPDGTNWCDSGAIFRSLGSRVQATVPASNAMSFFRLTYPY